MNVALYLSMLCLFTQPVSILPNARLVVPVRFGKNTFVPLEMGSAKNFVFLLQILWLCVFPEPHSTSLGGDSHYISLVKPQQNILSNAASDGFYFIVYYLSIYYIMNHPKIA